MESENKNNKRIIKSIKFSGTLTLILSFILLMSLEQSDKTKLIFGLFKNSDTVITTILILIPIFFITLFIISFLFHLLKDNKKKKKETKEINNEKQKEK